MYKYPICGKRINRGKAHLVIEHEGYRFFLCYPRCQPELGQKVKKTPVQHHRH